MNVIDRARALAEDALDRDPAVARLLTGDWDDMPDHYSFTSSNGSRFWVVLVKNDVYFNMNSQLIFTNLTPGSDLMIPGRKFGDRYEMYRILQSRGGVIRHFQDGVKHLLALETSGIVTPIILTGGLKIVELEIEKYGKTRVMERIGFRYDDPSNELLQDRIFEGTSEYGDPVDFSHKFPDD